MVYYYYITYSYYIFIYFYTFLQTGGKTSCKIPASNGTIRHKT